MGSVFLLVLVSSPSLPFFDVFPDSDTAWLLKTGLWIIDHHRLPAYNPLAEDILELSKIPVVCYQWLFEVLLGLFYKIMGFNGLVLLVASLFAGFIGFLVLWLKQRQFPMVASVVCAIAFGLLALNTNAAARPILLSCLFTAIELWLISRFGFQKKGMWALFALFLVWANSHLGFLAGLFVLLVYAVEDAWRQKNWQAPWIFIVCLLLTLVNPYGFTLYGYFATLAASLYMNAHINELQPLLSQASVTTWVYLSGVILAAFLAFRLRPNRLRVPDCVLLTVGFALALYSARHIYLLGIFSLPFLAAAAEHIVVSGLLPLKISQRLADSGFNAPQRDSEVFAWTSLIFLLGLLLSLPATGLGIVRAEFPKARPLSGVIAYLNQRPKPLLILCNERWGSYLLYFSKSRCALDSRLDMYGDAWVKKQVALYWMQTPDWQKTLDNEQSLRYALYPLNAVQAKILQQRLGWHALYADQAVILLQRSD